VSELDLFGAKGAQHIWSPARRRAGRCVSLRRSISKSDEQRLFQSRRALASAAG